MCGCDRALILAKDSVRRRSVHNNVKSKKGNQSWAFSRDFFCVCVCVCVSNNDDAVPATTLVVVRG